MFPCLFLLLFSFTLLTTSQSKVTTENNSIYDSKHGIQMGKTIIGCDDAESNLDLDWDDDPIEYTCYHPKSPFPVLPEVNSQQSCLNLSKNYFPQHHCMDEPLTYNTTIPTYGDHRPLWPVFGEYTYTPPQRWLHNIEHGSIVMLYHPCAQPLLISRLRTLVTNCIRKHILTPYRKLTRERPLALVAWGCKLEMNRINDKEVVNFIKKNALHGPEGNYSEEGQYEYKLLKKAEVPIGSDENDSKLCPMY